MKAAEAEFMEREMKHTTVGNNGYSGASGDHRALGSECADAGGEKKNFERLTVK